MDHQAPRGRPCVAVMSSDRSFIAFVRTMLHEIGLDVTARERWSELAPVVHERRPPAIVVDLNVHAPERGWAALQSIRADPATRATPLIVCTAASWLLDDRTEDLRAADAHLWLDPFDPAALLSTMESSLPAEVRTQQWSDSGLVTLG
jgi:CheY-like chemotaxis protein